MWWVGLELYGFSCAVMIQAVLGIDPWDTLNQGISVITGAPFGVVVIIVGVGVLLRQKPGIGTVLNVLIIGVTIDLFLGWLPVERRAGSPLPSTWEPGSAPARAMA